MCCPVRAVISLAYMVVGQPCGVVAIVIAVVLAPLLLLTVAVRNHVTPVFSLWATIVSECIQNHTSSCLEKLNQMENDTIRELEQCRAEIQRIEGRQWMIVIGTSCAWFLVILLTIWAVWCYCRCCRARSHVSVTVNASSPPDSREQRPPQEPPAPVVYFSNNYQYNIENAFIPPMAVPGPDHRSRQALQDTS